MFLFCSLSCDYSFSNHRKTMTTAAKTIPTADSASAVDGLIGSLKKRYSDRITGELLMPARAGRYCALPDGLHPKLKHALRFRGIERLYSHQAAAWNSISAGKHTVVVTPTASGKTLCYNLPILQSSLQENSRALYLFPTKALAQDQLAELIALNQAGELGVKAFTFDGDTPGDARKAVRLQGEVVISNPDMLHQGILPHHTKWAQFFETLRYVVIDEMHTYRGIFGAHVANVIRRLKRICRFYGSEPRFIFCSATIANPQHLAEQLLEEPVQAITENGAPCGERHLLLWNPPVVNPDLGIRASARSQSTRIARAATQKSLKSIVFAGSRLMVEVLTKYLKDDFDKDPRKPSRIAAYRGGYLPKERRDIEKRLRDADIDCVVSTSALELGVDIGALDVCILNGYPGSVAAAWQRLGRAGRRQRKALGILVASSQPLDQYMIRHPDFFLGASPESAHIEPDQLLILLEHVRCAAFELPFKQGEHFCGEALPELLDYLQEQGVLHQEGQHWHWNEEAYPANNVSLRSVADGNFVVIDIDDGQQKIIAEVDYSSAALTLYEGAIYMVQASPWQVERLDWVGRKAFVRPTKADYYTDAIDYTRLKILEQFQQAQIETSACAQGEVHLVRRVAGYKKIRYYSHENIGYGDVNLPDQEMHTTAVWWEIAPHSLEAAFSSRQLALDGFLGAAYAMHHVAAMLLMTENRDLGRAVGDGNAKWFASVGQHGRGRLIDEQGNPLNPDSPERFRPAVFLYDNFPGGVGLTAPLFERHSQVINQAEEMIAGCSCSYGCPSCVGPISQTEEDNQSAIKAAALTVLRLLQ